MTTWVDIVSVRLRTVFQHWSHFRAARPVPHVDDYPRFAKANTIESASNSSVVLLASPDRAKWPVVHTGSAVRKMLPNLHPGEMFQDGQLPYARIGLANWPFATARTAAISCERGCLGYGAEQWDFEVLVLPFSDDRNKVGIVHTVFDIPRTPWQESAP
jgi:hypothetical protein